jgi:hypothetical protein
MYIRSAVLVSAAVVLMHAQEQAPAPASASDNSAPASTPLQRAEPASPDEFVVAVGTRIPLSMINSVSTKTAVSGERVYLESVFRFSSTGT